MAVLTLISKLCSSQSQIQGKHSFAINAIHPIFIFPTVPTVNYPHLEGSL